MKCEDLDGRQVGWPRSFFLILAASFTSLGGFGLFLFRVEIRKGWERERVMLQYRDNPRTPEVGYDSHILVNLGSGIRLRSSRAWVGGQGGWTEIYKTSTRIHDFVLYRVFCMEMFLSFNHPK
jgi:hypothetical protein